MNCKKITVAIVFVILAIITTALFWKQQILLSCFLIILALLKHVFAPIKRGPLWFFLVGILGTTTESLIMFLGNNPWSYADPLLINIPLWLIPLWGLAGIIFITLHEGMFQTK
jgi:hypothetical protein